MAKKVYIDAGHGGSDPGAVDGKSGSDVIYTEEEDLNLIVAKHLNTALKRSGVETKMSRTKDVYPSLQQRANEANAFGADVFVSVHFNAASSPSARGIEVLYYPTSTMGKALATAIYRFISQATPWPDRGIIARSGLYVLRHTRMPAVIVEGGFITNTEEERLVNTPVFQVNLAELIAKGVCLHLGVKYVPPAPPEPVSAPLEYEIGVLHASVPKMKKIVALCNELSVGIFTAPISRESWAPIKKAIVNFRKR